MIPPVLALYYIAACCKKVGMDISGEIDSLAGHFTETTHNWLLAQDPTYFEQENFVLERKSVADSNITKSSLRLITI